MKVQIHIWLQYMYTSNILIVYGKDPNFKFEHF